MGMRKQFTNEFKAKVAMAALKGDKTMAELGIACGRCHTGTLMSLMGLEAVYPYLLRGVEITRTNQVLSTIELVVMSKLAVAGGAAYHRRGKDMIKAIPESYHTITPSFTFKDSKKAIEFYKKAFGAKVLDRMPDPSGRRTMHATMATLPSAFTSTFLTWMRRSSRPSRPAARRPCR